MHFCVHSENLKQKGTRKARSRHGCGQKARDFSQQAMRVGVRGLQKSLVLSAGRRRAIFLLFLLAQEYETFLDSLDRFNAAASKPHFVQRRVRDFF